VIGNPPYLYSAGKDHTDYFESHYRLSQYQTDFYVYFLEKALSLARTGGKVSYIVPDSWLNSDYYSALRTCLLSEHRLDRLAVFDYPVFARVTLENSVLVVSVRTRPAAFPIVRFGEPNCFEESNVIDPGAAVSRGIIDPRCSQASERVLAKIETGSVPLGDVARVNRGIHAYRTDGYGISKFARGPQTKKDKEERSYHARRRLNDTYLPELKGKDVFRFSFTPTGDYLSYGPWLAEPREPAFFHKPKLALRKILGPRLHGTYIEKPCALDQSLYIVITKDCDASTLKFILAVMLSRLGAWYLRTKYAIYDSLYPWYTKKQLATFPMKQEDARLVRLTDLMLDLHTRLQKAKSQADKEALERQIAATDRQIDALVYELYGLSESEVEIVEGSK